MEDDGSEKKRRHPRGMEVVDMIQSKLPETIITEILSLLPTKEAVRTSILSKNWIHSWKSITKLLLDDSESYNYSALCTLCGNHSYSCCIEFQKDKSIMCIDCLYGEHELEYIRSLSYLKKKTVFVDLFSMLKIFTGAAEELFINFMDKALLGTPPLISNTTDLETFSFKIYNQRNESLQNSWISSILNRRVKNLRIHSYYTLNFCPLTSDYLFNSCSLQELELLLFPLSTIYVPITSSLHFQQLKILNLCGIFFDIDPSIEFLNLNLPAVKKIQMKNCSWSSGKDVVVQAPLLETLSIGQDKAFYYFHLDTDYVSTQSIKFNAFHLKDFSYSGYGTAQKIHLPSYYDSANITFFQVTKTASEIKRLPFITILLRQFHQVKCIKFEDFPFEMKVLPQADIPIFSMLSHLELGLVPVELLIGFLQNSPVLKTLVLKGIPEFAEEILNFVVMPRCLVSSLQDVKFGKVNGEVHELLLLKLFVENGKVLESIAFFIPTQTLNSKIMEEFKEKLYSFKKASSFVEFSYDY